MIPVFYFTSVINQPMNKSAFVIEIFSRNLILKTINEV